MTHQHVIEVNFPCSKWEVNPEIPTNKIVRRRLILKRALPFILSVHEEIVAKRSNSKRITFRIIGMERIFVPSGDILHIGYVANHPNVDQKEIETQREIFYACGWDATISYEGTLRNFGVSA
jgi:hypothetical protein